MWPFKKKLLSPPTLDMQLKSLTLPQAQPNWKLYARHNPWNAEKALLEGYNASAIVYACVEKRAKLLASVPFKAMRITPEGLEHDPNSPLQQLIDNPNPDQCFYEILYGASQNLDLTGNAFISEIRAGTRNAPQQLWLLPSQYVKIKPGRENLIDYFEYSYQTAMGNKKIMAADINIKLPDDATREQVASIREQYEKMQTGSNNARRALMTNADIQQLGMNAVELDFVESRKSVWTEITAVFGMSLSDLGMTENVNLSNAEAMNKNLWQNTIIPTLELIERQLNHQLAVEFPGYKLVADTSNIEALQESQEAKIGKVEKLYRMGVPFNTLAQHFELGFEPVEGGDIGYIPTGLIPVGFSFDEPSEEEKMLFKAMLKDG